MGLFEKSLFPARCAQGAPVWAPRSRIEALLMACHLFGRNECDVISMSLGRRIIPQRSAEKKNKKKNVFFRRVPFQRETVSKRARVFALIGRQHHLFQVVAPPSPKTELRIFELFFFF